MFLTPDRICSQMEDMMSNKYWGTLTLSKVTPPFKLHGDQWPTIGPWMTDRPPDTHTDTHTHKQTHTHTQTHTQTQTLT